MGSDRGDLHVGRPTRAAIETGRHKKLRVVVDNSVPIVRQSLAKIVAGVPPLGGHDSRKLIHDNVGQKVTGEAVVKIIHSNRPAPGETIVSGKALKDVDVRPEAAIQTGSVRRIAVNKIQSAVEGTAAVVEGQLCFSV